MTPNWIIQNNLHNSPTYSLLSKTCALIGVPCFGVEVYAGQITLPIELPDSPLIAHGATTLVKIALADPRFQHGIFFDEENFCHEAYASGLGKAYLNSDATLTNLDEARKMLQKDGNLFIKPPDDLKAFTGFVANESTFENLVKKRAGKLPEKVVVSPVVEVDAEWRLFVVDGTIVSGSMYLPYGDSGLPTDLLDFARDVIREWTPAPVFVVDIGRINGGWAVVECNCFNWSRFYESNVARIVESVSAYQVGLLEI